MIPLIKEYPGLRAGLTLCGIWSSDVLVDECKVLVLVSEDPFFDEGGVFQITSEVFPEYLGDRALEPLVLCRKIRLQEVFHLLRDRQSDSDEDNPGSL